MSNLLNLLGEHLTPQLIGQLSRQMGTDDSATKNVISSALPVLMSALASGTQKPQGASALLGALTRDNRHDGSVLGQLGNLIQKPEQGEGNGILRHLLGGKRDFVEKNLSESTGVNRVNTSKVLQVLAPMVLGLVGKQQRQKNMNASQVSQLLQQSQQAFTKQAPKEMGVVGRLLDKDGDGKVVDDVANIGMRLLGNFLTRR